MLLQELHDLVAVPGGVQKALFGAAAGGNAQLIRLLVGHADANVSEPNVVGKSALHIAAESGLSSTICALLEAGAAVDAKDSDGCTPLLAAAEAGNNWAVPLLLAGGADVSLAGGFKQRAALHWVAQKGSVEIV